MFILKKDNTYFSTVSENYLKKAVDNGFEHIRTTSDWSSITTFNKLPREVKTQKKNNHLIKCSCGCGESLYKYRIRKRQIYTKKGMKEYISYIERKYINGHNKSFKDKHHTDKSKEKISNFSKKRFKDPKERDKISNGLKKYFEDPKSRENASIVLKKYYIDYPEARRKASKKTKKQFEKPEARRKQSERLKKYFEDPEARKKVSINSTDWDFFKEHGTTRSKYPYANIFNNKFKQKIRELYNNECVITGMTNDEHRKRYNSSLHIHHWMYDKDSTKPFYFVPVTRSINSQANGSRMQWMELFNMIAEEHYCKLMKNQIVRTKLKTKEVKNYT